MTNQTTDVVIIGGGAAGCAAAYYLAENGVKATIIEREGVGSQASGYNAGGLNPLEGHGWPEPLQPMASIPKMRLVTRCLARSRKVARSGTMPRPQNRSDTVR